LPTPRFCYREYFVDANILLTRIFCRNSWQHWSWP
jgi:hypothetical protein